MITVLSLSPAIDKIYYVDNFRPGGLYRVNKVVKSAGGKGVNVAKVASALGNEVRLIGFKAGEAGNWLENQLKRPGLETCFVEVKGETRTNSNIIDKVSNTETELLEKGPFITEDDVEKLMPAILDGIKKSEVLVCSGGLPEGMKKDFYGRIISLAKDHGVKVILDTSGEMLEQGIKASPFLVKPNKRELESCTGNCLDNLSEAVNACKKIISQGVEIIVASMGKEGAILVSPDKCVKASVPPVEPVNTIGCGDSMVAGMACALCNKG